MGVGVSNRHFLGHLVCRSGNLLLDLPGDEEVGLGPTKIAVRKMKIIVIKVFDPTSGVEALGGFLVLFFEEVEEEVLLTDTVKSNVEKLRPEMFGTTHSVGEN